MYLMKVTVFISECNASTIEVDKSVISRDYIMKHAKIVLLQKY